MARFIFELEAVLEAREWHERRQQRAVGELDRQRLAIERRAQEVQARLAEGRSAMRQALGSRGDPGSLGGVVAIDQVRVQASASLHDMVALRKVALELAGAQQRLAAARQQLLKATIARKAVEALRTRRYIAWKREQDRRENAAVDELAVMHHGRDKSLGEARFGD